LIIGYISNISDIVDSNIRTFFLILAIILAREAWLAKEISKSGTKIFSESLHER
jgi:hypothetical protein